MSADFKPPKAANTARADQIAAGLPPAGAHKTRAEEIAADRMEREANMRTALRRGTAAAADAKSPVTDVDMDLIVSRVRSVESDQAVADVGGPLELGEESDGFPVENIHASGDALPVGTASGQMLYWVHDADPGFAGWGITPGPSGDGVFYLKITRAGVGVSFEWVAVPEAIPSKPLTGTHVLACDVGVLKWIETAAFVCPP